MCFEDAIKLPGILEFRLIIISATPPPHTPTAILGKKIAEGRKAGIASKPYPPPSSGITTDYPLLSFGRRSNEPGHAGF